MTYMELACNQISKIESNPDDYVDCIATENYFHRRTFEEPFRTSKGVDNGSNIMFKKIQCNAQWNAEEYAITSKKCYDDEQKNSQKSITLQNAFLV